MRVLHSPDGRFLSDEQRAQLEALFDALLPGDDTTPGARDAGAVDFVDAQLGRDPSTYYEIAGWRDVYSRGLEALDAAARATNGGHGLADLPGEQVTALCAQLQQGRLEGFPAELDQRRLFATLRNHCIEGCFADPRWHGNRDAVMWRWLGTHGPAEEFQRQRAEVSHGV
jgi:gluconate 2-dehydrogenase gamma chain